MKKRKAGRKIITKSKNIKLKRKKKVIKAKSSSKKRRYTSPKFKAKNKATATRAKKKLRALLPEYNLKTRTDLIEMDEKYIQDLKNDPKAAEWLNKFNTEFVNASFNTHKGHLHKSKKAKRECYSRNNARNRCIYTREKAQGKLDSIEDIREQQKRDEENFENDYLDTLFASEEFDNLKKGSNEPDDSTES